MSDIDQQFVEYIVKSLVGNPDAVSIVRCVDEKGILLELTVDPEDLGRVIGKRGATAQSLRTLLRALGTKNDARYNLKIIDNGDPRPSRDDAGSSYSTSTSTSTSTRDSTTSGDSTTSSRSTASDDLDLDDEDTKVEKLSDKLSKTRAELNDLDDLDI